MNESIKTPYNFVKNPPGSSFVGRTGMRVERHVYTYSDHNYEYIIHRTRQLNDEFDKALKIKRYKAFDMYGRLPLPDESNNYLIVSNSDPRNFVDRYGLIQKPPEGFEGVPVLAGGYQRVWSSVVENFFSLFSIDYSYRSVSLYYFLYYYFYVTEYVIPTVWLYFPFIYFFSYGRPIFGTGTFWEYNLFEILFVFYLPFVLYVFFRFWYTSFDWHERFNVARFFLIVWSLVSSVIFLPAIGLFSLFLPLFSVFFFILFSYFPDFDDSVSDDFSRVYNTAFFSRLLAAPARPPIRYLPIYYYQYQKFPAVSVSESKVHARSFRTHFTRYPFFNFSSQISNIRRVRAVNNFIYFSSILPASTTPFSGTHIVAGFNFMVDPLPKSFGFEPFDFFQVENEPKTSNVDADPETDEKLVENYLVDGMHYEIGVSNISFFSADYYHFDYIAKNYRYYLGGFSEYDLLTPSSFSSRAKIAFGPYYNLAIWLSIVQPEKQYSSEFSSTYIKSTYFYKSPVKQKWYLNPDTHTFVPSFVVFIVTNFYALIEWFIGKITFFAYYKPVYDKDTMLNTINKFSYYFRRAYYHPNLLRQFFKFLIFIDKTYEFEPVPKHHPFFISFFTIYYHLLRTRRRLNSFPFNRIFSKRINYIDACLRRIRITYKNFSLCDTGGVIVSCLSLMLCLLPTNLLFLSVICGILVFFLFSVWPFNLLPDFFLLCITFLILIPPSTALSILYETSIMAGFCAILMLTGPLSFLLAFIFMFFVVFTMAHSHILANQFGMLEVLFFFL